MDTPDPVAPADDPAAAPADVPVMPEEEEEEGNEEEAPVDPAVPAE